MGRGGVKPLEFKTFSQPMQEATPHIADKAETFSSRVLM